MKAPDIIYIREKGAETCRNCQRYKKSCDYDLFLLLPYPESPCKDFSPLSTQRLIAGHWSIRGFDKNEVAYIRKETILEWAKQEQLNSDTILQDDFWQKVIDKLNEMK